MRSYPSPLITDRWAEWERRLARLEALLGSGLAGTDQTIKGSHDRLDALLGASVATASLSNGTTLGTNTAWATIAKTGITDNVATAIFTVTTTDEAGSTDGGAWVAHVYVLASHAAGSAEGTVAVKAESFTVAHVNIAAGAAVSVIDELHEGSVAASAPALKTVTSVTPTATKTSDYVTTVNLTIDLGGTAVGTAQAVCFVVLEWTGYLHAPAIAAV